MTSPGASDPPDEPQQAVQYRKGLRRAAGDIEIDRKKTGGSIMNLLMAAVRPAGNGTSPDGNDQLGRWYGFVGLEQAEAHIFRDGARYEDPVGVPWRGDELDPEPPQVPSYGSENVGIGFAGIAPARADLAQFQRSSEKTSYLFVRRLCRSCGRRAYD